MTNIDKNSKIEILDNNFSISEINKGMIRLNIYEYEINREVNIICISPKRLLLEARKNTYTAKEFKDLIK